MTSQLEKHMDGGPHIAKRKPAILAEVKRAHSVEQVSRPKSLLRALGFLRGAQGIMPVPEKMKRPAYASGYRRGARFFRKETGEDSYWGRIYLPKKGK